MADQTLAQNHTLIQTARDIAASAMVQDGIADMTRAGTNDDAPIVKAVLTALDRSSDLFHATRALLIAMKEEDNPENLTRYVEGVEDALAKVEDETGWEAAVEAEIERQVQQRGVR